MSFENVIEYVRVGSCRAEGCGAVEGTLMGLSVVYRMVDGKKQAGIK